MVPEALKGLNRGAGVEDLLDHCRDDRAAPMTSRCRLQRDPERSLLGLRQSLTHQGGDQRLKQVEALVFYHDAPLLIIDRTPLLTVPAGTPAGVQRVEPCPRGTPERDDRTSDGFNDAGPLALGVTWNEGPAPERQVAQRHALQKRGLTCPDSADDCHVRVAQQPLAVVHKGIEAERPPGELVVTDQYPFSSTSSRSQEGILHASLVRGDPSSAHVSGYH